MAVPAAIALFLYNRPHHSRRVVEALAANPLAAATDLYVFCDGAKDAADRRAVDAVHAYAARITGFRSVNVTHAGTNLGIARSIIGGVSRVFDRHERAIIVEDDLLMSAQALAFFNTMLDRYAETPEVSSISGFAYPQHAVPIPARFPYDVYFTPRLNCWGWATWRDRWLAVEWEQQDAGEVLADPRRSAAFGRAGNDLLELWRLQRAGEIDSWAVPWAIDQLRRGLVTVHPRRSYVQNIGFDGTGTHHAGDDQSLNQATLSNATQWRIPPHVTCDRRILWAHKDRFDRLMATGRVRRLLSVPAWWVRLARRRARAAVGRSLSQDLIATADRIAGEVHRRPRRQPGQLRIGGRAIRYADLHSFYHQARQIFGGRLYDFSTSVAAPVILDCGAHIGLASIRFKERHPAARIRAYEADPAIAAMCADNLSACGFDDVTVTAAAVWTHADGVRFSRGADDSGHITDAGATQLPSMRLRDVIAAEPVDLLKLDIEGAEFEVLADCADALGNVRRLIVEVHVFGHADDRVGALLGLLETQGFRYTLADLHHATWKPATDTPPFTAAPTDKYYFTIFAWRPDQP